MWSPVSFLVIAADEAASEAGHSSGLLQDTTFWVSLGFLAVVGIFWRLGVHKTVAGLLDQRKEKIADELEAARRLREEAQELLAQYQRRQREAEDEAKGIIEQAKRDADRMGRDARQKINDQLERRAKSAEEKIARAEAQAIADVRNQTTDVAIAAARTIINERMDSGAQSALIEKSIADLRNRMN
ncbi:MAG: F0F1 ATP synthase subunit B [Pseudomonadota bacterium]